MNNIVKRYINQNGIQPGDSLVVNRSLFDSLDPFVLYGGLEHFALRKPKGLQWLRPGQTMFWLRYHQPKQANRFLGSSQQRKRYVTQLLNGDEQAYFRLLKLSEYYNPGLKKSSQKRDDNIAKGVGIALGLGALLLIGGALISSLNQDEEKKN